MTLHRSISPFTKTATTGLLAATMALSVSLTGTGAASAATAQPATSSSAVSKVATEKKVGSTKAPIKGVAENGRKVRGSFTPTEFTVVDGVLNVTGTLEGRFTGKGKPTPFSQEITTPVQSVNGAALQAPATRGQSAPLAAAAPTAAAPGSCDILNLDLGPLNLDILGLQVNLQRVVLDIVAQSGAGNLLGNLLCAVAGLLDGGPLAGLLDQLSTLLNRILGVLNP
ncbi:hypothetical protein [Nocardioides aurantiacus]|uniref:ABC transporter substrate-binding protein n=1 Tax=Nocardioides aurantiacus TaxID=86796 RepID=A0A3N2CY89_9ACTN|nr:hypothetical protein [Nocardioides aurantiacus]ROR92502.1 hypothetical protein EDD33_3393 [Nocardioides aurantiacus]